VTGRQGGKEGRLENNKVSRDKEQMEEREGAKEAND
jgi:hypothetical protein